MTSAPAVEPQMLSDMKDKNNQSLVENLMGTTKSQQFSCLLIRVTEGIRTHGQRISMRELLRCATTAAHINQACEQKV